MPYTYRFLTAKERAEIASRVTTQPDPPSPPGEPQLRAWEAELAAHQALLKVAEDDDAKREHADAIKVLESVLTESTPRSSDREPT